MVPKYASTGLVSSSVVIPSIAARILLFAHSLYATSLRSWLVSAIAIVISPSPLWDQSVGRRRDARANATQDTRCSRSVMRKLGRQQLLVEQGPALLTLLEFQAMNGTFSIDPESVAGLVVGDVPAAAGAVLANRACASALPRVSAAGAQPRSADAKNLESNIQMVVSTTRTGATWEISSAY